MTRTIFIWSQISVFLQLLWRILANISTWRVRWCTPRTLTSPWWQRTALGAKGWNERGSPGVILSQHDNLFNIKTWQNQHNYFVINTAEDPSSNPWLLRYSLISNFSISSTLLLWHILANISTWRVRWCTPRTLTSPWWQRTALGAKGWNERGSPGVILSQHDNLFNYKDMGKSTLTILWSPQQRNCLPTHDFYGIHMISNFSISSTLLLWHILANISTWRVRWCTPRTLTSPWWQRTALGAKGWNERGSPGVILSQHDNLFNIKTWANQHNYFVINHSRGSVFQPMTFTVFIWSQISVFLRHFCCGTFWPTSLPDASGDVPQGLWQVLVGMREGVLVSYFHNMTTLIKTWANQHNYFAINTEDVGIFFLEVRFNWWLVSLHPDWFTLFSMMVQWKTLESLKGKLTA